MKKLILLIPLILLLTSCGTDKTKTTDKTESADNSETAGSGDSKEQYIIPDYTPASDAEAAAYLMKRYGVDISDKPKVILDCDMIFLGDDAMAMSILVQADTLGLINLLGITVTGGNSCVAAETNAVLKQLECIGRSDIPVYMGTDEPIEGFRDMDKQEEIVGNIQHWGLLYRLDDYIEPSGYHDLGAFFERKWGYSETEPQSISSVQFMKESVQKYPGEVTIISTGAPTNIAHACMEEESFARNSAGIIYIGTILYGSGTYTPYADFNCFYDPKAFEICLQSDFPSHTVVPHEAAGDAVLNKAVFDLLESKTKTKISVLWLENQYSMYRRTPTRTDSCIDAIGAVIFLNPAVISETETHAFTINTDVSSAEYGSITVCSDTDESSDISDSVNADFVLRLNTDIYWDFTTDLLSHTQSVTPYSYANYSK